MSSFYNARGPQGWRSRRNLQTELTRRVELAGDPEAFRRGLRLNPDLVQPAGELLQNWQRADFAALDPAWKQLAGLEVSTDPVWRAWIERPRGHAKTADMAVQLIWILQHGRKPVRGLAAAADREQAALIKQAMQLLARLNPQSCGLLEYRQHLVQNPRTGSRLEIISSDVQSSWGALPDFVICDELCHWDKPDLWHSLFSSAAKKPRCLLAVLTNAGVGRGWQWTLRETARSSSLWYFHSLPGPLAPWLPEANLREQQLLLPPAVYDRLWRNLWQDASGDFVTLAEAEACRDAALSAQQRGWPPWQYVAAVDYAEKHDDTVGVILHREPARVVVDRLDVVRPAPAQPTPVAWVEQWIEQSARQFPGIRFVLDEYQLLGTIQKLESRFEIQRFAFLGGAGNHALAMTLRRLIVQRELAWYPGCGQIPDLAHRDDLETELASLLLKQSAAGMCRIDHKSDGLHHDDRSFALGAALLQAVQLPQESGDYLHVEEW